jgi:glycosyltransferase involved in cell wall biosynthesis
MSTAGESILLTANTAWYLYNFRANLIRALVEEGYGVILIAPADRFTKELERLGAQVFNITIDQRGTRPLADLLTLFQYVRFFRRLSPSMVMSFTVKPVIYGSVAARLLKVPYINTITGLGSAFIYGSGTRRLVSFMYKHALKRSQAVFFQNPNDLALFKEHNLVKNGQYQIVAGSGIDLAKFTFAPMPENPKFVFLMVARLFKDKGVYEFVEAAENIRAARKDIVFRLVGGFDQSNNQFAVSPGEMHSWVKRGVVEYRGEVENICEEMRSADCVVLPSYREGMSKVLMEAAAMGRPIIATDVPGCKEAVVSGENGYLCSPKNANDLRRVMLCLRKLPLESRQRMGRTSRRLAETHFGDQTVINAYLNCIFDVASVE